MQQKKKSRRSKLKYPELNVKFNLKTRSLDIYDVLEYFDKLTLEEKRLMKKFLTEYNNASFNNHTDHLHDTAELVKKCYDRNNARNRDIYTRTTASGALSFLEDGFESLKDSSDPEQALLNKESEELDEKFNQITEIQAQSMKRRRK